MNFNITPQKFIEIKKKYGHYASWAVWGKEGATPKSNMNAEIFKDASIIKTLQTNYILVALNISRAIKYSDILTRIRIYWCKKTILIAIGNDSYKILKRNFHNKFEILKIPHYANYTSKEKFREQVLTVLNNIN